jgi:hypothetical protein
MEKAKSLETTKFYTLDFRGQQIALTEKKAQEYKPEFVKVWEFQISPYSGGAAISVGRQIGQSGLIGVGGVGDEEGVQVLRGKLIAMELLKSWNRTDNDGQPLPITAENVDSLPKTVLQQLVLHVEGRIAIPEGELDALKKPVA